MRARRPGYRAENGLTVVLVVAALALTFLSAIVIAYDLMKHQAEPSGMQTIGVGPEHAHAIAAGEPPAAIRSPE